VKSAGGEVGRRRSNDEDKECQGCIEKKEEEAEIEKLFVVTQCEDPMDQTRTMASKLVDARGMM